MKILGKRVIDKDFREIFTSEFISITGGLIAGVFLLGLANKLELIPGLFILLPGFLEMHGNIFGSLAARLGTLLNTKHIKPKFEHNKILLINILSSILLVLVVSLFLGVLATLLNYFIFKSYSLILIFVSLVAGIISLIIELPLTVLTTFWVFNNGYDPDDIMGPYVTTIGDIISVLSLFIVILVVI
ncbi:magnesium transporter [Candidatus Woesearchaeota archaeon]|nr:magnesium transporter [Candidatus Woesearchaeota archaeon]